MTLAAGAKLGPYEIVSPVGAGGMGEVYRARDTRLDRLVAIKVLPEAFMADADRRARFEREAQAVAALSHPNILAIHDTGIHAGQTFVVTELLEGETLRDRLRSGGVPVRKAIDCALQIARALGAAHAKGIVHRDLKPENVFLLADGQVKLIDFGLARAPADRGTLETVTATEPGTVMGTVGYMAPEQVRGLTVDARADLFALGAVLYEMLSGRAAFKRDTVADTMTAVLNEDPQPLTAVQTDVPRALQQIVHHALEKNPTERFQSARDFGFALDALSGSATSGMTAVSQVTRPSSSRTRYAAIILIAAALTGSVRFRATFGPTVGSRRHSIRSEDIRASVHHQRPVPSRRPEHRLQRGPRGECSRAVREPPEYPGAPVHRTPAHPSPVGLVAGRIGCPDRREIRRTSALRGHTGPNADRRSPSGLDNERSRGRLVARRIQSGGRSFR